LNGCRDGGRGILFRKLHTDPARLWTLQQLECHAVEDHARVHHIGGLQCDCLSSIRTNSQVQLRILLTYRRRSLFLLWILGIWPTHPWRKGRNQKNFRAKLRKKNCALVTMIQIETSSFRVADNSSGGTRERIASKYSEAVGWRGSVHTIYDRRSASNRAD